MNRQYFASVSRGLETLMAGELRRLGGERIRQVRAGVAFSGSLTTAYRVCLWSRLAARLLMPVARGTVRDADDLYALVQTVDWSQHLEVDGTLAVDFNGTNPKLRDTRFSGQRVKDAVVDQFRARHGGRRPAVDPQQPDLRLNAHLAGGEFTLAVDLSGDSLHRRGYRPPRLQVEAPLKENLAAGVLLFADWPRWAADGGAFLDPLCGSATLPIEAALMAADIAPGLLRAHADDFGLCRWRGHDATAWAALVREADERRQAGLAAVKGHLTISGRDHDRGALEIAAQCVRRAGLDAIVRLEATDLGDGTAPDGGGLLATNAPYGRRLGTLDSANAVYRQLGSRLRQHFAGWQAAVLAGERAQLDALGIEFARTTEISNGPLRCPLGLTVTIAAANERSAPADDAAASLPAAIAAGAEQFAHRLHKNRRQLSRQIRKEELTCYRVYDADLPDFNFVIDVYGDRLCLQEYAPPSEIAAEKTQGRLEAALAAVAAEFELPPASIVVKQRRRQRGSAQYERQARREHWQQISEDGLSYLVNLEDFLDTGFFIDQRLTRRLTRANAAGGRFLNLFAYTGTMSVNALAGGARHATSVDLSATYLEWAARNHDLNGFGAEQHSAIQADCLQWIATADGQYDLIWLDPPTFSNSKRMGRATFDVQRDHADLLRMTARRLLAENGTLLFATNRRGFTLAVDDLDDFVIRDLSRATLPFDCGRSANRHFVYELRRRS